ncbi:MAG: tRNA glutamyl-Q(34) synthetase GluQRS [Dialister sp.]|nr:tRNA glutamyl-Q(34) synthetase GluQRS [Dialister sp.]
MDKRTRFAPSPTGYLHLGNIWIAFLNWLWSRQNRAKIVLRIEDIDRERCHKEYADQLIENLLWLGLDWDEGPGGSYSYGEPVQSKRLGLYGGFCHELQRRGMVYPCFCSRARLRKISSAPHEGEAVSVYDGACRDLSEEERRAFSKTPSWRIKVCTDSLSYTDMILGERKRLLEAKKDDFVIRRADGMISYQLACAYDDAHMGITHVFRGNDLADSSFYQMYLIQLMGKPVPGYGHLPLLVDKAGIRLSKRQKGITLKEMREAGISAEKIIGLLLYLAGGLSRPEPVSAAAAAERIPFSELSALHQHHICVYQNSAWF